MVSGKKTLKKLVKSFKMGLQAADGSGLRAQMWGNLVSVFTMLLCVDILYATVKDGLGLWAMLAV